MDFKDAIGAIIAGVILLVPAIKWLIADWAKKSRQLEEEREKSRARSLSRFEKDIVDFRTDIDRIQISIRDLNATLVQHKADVSLLKERFDDLKKSMDHYSKNFDSSLRNLIKTEIVELSKQAALIRAKKNGA